MHLLYFCLVQTLIVNLLRPSSSANTLGISIHNINIVDECSRTWEEVKYGCLYICCVQEPSQSMDVFD